MKTKPTDAGGKHPSKKSSRPRYARLDETGALLPESREDILRLAEKQGASRETVEKMLKVLTGE